MIRLDLSFLKRTYITDEARQPYRDQLKTIDFYARTNTILYSLPWAEYFTTGGDARFPILGTELKIKLNQMVVAYGAEKAAKNKQELYEFTDDQVGQLAPSGKMILQAKVHQLEGTLACNTQDVRYHQDATVTALANVQRVTDKLEELEQQMEALKKSGNSTFTAMLNGHLASIEKSGKWLLMSSRTDKESAEESIKMALSFVTREPIVTQWVNPGNKRVTRVKTGQFTAKIHFDRDRLRITCGQFKDNLDGRHIHPHVSRGGNICWGNLNPKVTDHLLNNNFHEVLEYLWKLLTHYSPANPYVTLATFRRGPKINTTAIMLREVRRGVLRKILGNCELTLAEVQELNLKEDLQFTEYTELYNFKEVFGTNVFDKEHPFSRDLVDMLQGKVGIYLNTNSHQIYYRNDPSDKASTYNTINNHSLTNEEVRSTNLVLTNAWTTELTLSACFALQAFYELAIEAEPNTLPWYETVPLVSIGGTNTKKVCPNALADLRAKYISAEEEEEEEEEPNPAINSTSTTAVPW